MGTPRSMGSREGRPTAGAADAESGVALDPQGDPITLVIPFVFDSLLLPLS